jgi:hypothetical protein
MQVPETYEGDHPEPAKGNYLLHADGSGTGTIDNPAQGAIGVVLNDPDGHVVAEISSRIGPATNNVAEYRALIEGLRLARNRRIRRIRVFLDSELVVDQLERPRGDWQGAPQTSAHGSVLPAPGVRKHQDFVGPAKMERGSGLTCNQSASWSLSASAHTGSPLISLPAQSPTKQG